MDVVYLANRQNDNRFVTPVQVLQDAIDDINSGNRKCTKILILTLDDGAGQYYDHGFYSAKMKCSEIISLLYANLDLFASKLNGRDQIMYPAYDKLKGVWIVGDVEFNKFEEALKYSQENDNGD